MNSWGVLHSFPGLGQFADWCRERVRLEDERSTIELRRKIGIELTEICRAWRWRGRSCAKRGPQVPTAGAGRYLMKMGLYVCSIRPYETYQIVDAIYLKIRWLKIRQCWGRNSAKGTLEFWPWTANWHLCNM